MVIHPFVGVKTPCLLGNLPLTLWFTQSIVQNWMKGRFTGNIRKIRCVKCRKQKSLRVSSPVALHTAQWSPLWPWQIMVNLYLHIFLCTHTQVRLVGGWLTPLKNTSQLGWLFPMYGKIKQVPSHQPDVYTLYTYTCWNWDKNWRPRGSHILLILNMNHPIFRASSSQQQWQSLGLGVGARFLLSAPKIGTEPWNLLLACKAGSI